MTPEKLKELERLSGAVKLLDEVLKDSGTIVSISANIKYSQNCSDTITRTIPEECIPDIVDVLIKKRQELQIEFDNA